MTLMSERPVVSVVVATHGRAQLLGRLVRALEAQDGVGRFEVIIVDDASTDHTWDELQHLAADAHVPLEPLRQARNRGPAAARNAGWRAARAALIAFTDDDCVPQPGWLATLVDGLSNADMVQGRTLPIPEREVGRGPFSRSLWIHEEEGRYETCNMGYRRAVLENVGGFDERFELPFGEDIDLAWRAKEAGARASFDRNALVYHDVFPSSYLAHLRDTRRREGLVRALSLHPGLRGHMHSRWFYRASHPRALLAAAGMGLVVRRPRSGWHCAAGALLALPYIYYRTVEDPPPCLPRNRVPVTALALVADLAEVGVLIWSSARYRTLLL
jgi:glycosyltransferase involved in cell wall biosynthesis